MQKPDVLLAIKRFIKEYSISKDELLGLYEDTPALPKVPTAHPRFVHVGILDLVAYVGGVIVALGIFILMALNWDNFNTPTRILVALGSTICAYVVGMLIRKTLPKISPVFFLIFGLVLPFGINSVFEALSLDTSKASVLAGLAAIVLAIMLVLYATGRQTILLVFSLLDATWLLLSLDNWLAASAFKLDLGLIAVLAAILAIYLIGRQLLYIAVAILEATWLFFSLGNSLFGLYSSLDYPIIEYQSVVVGVSYLLLAYYFASRKNFTRLSPFLYSLGSLIFLGSALMLGGWTPDNNIVWEIIAPILIVGTLYFSVKLRRNSLLVWGMIFLVGYIVKMSSEYFSGFGWPVVLIIAGLLIILSSSTVLHLRSKKVIAQL